MKVLNYILRPLWKIWFVLWFGIPFLILFPLFYFGLVTKRFSLVYKLKRFWARMISTAVMVFPVIRYQSKKYRLPEPCVVASNHTSYLDICFSPFYIQNTAVYMGKHELLKIPLFGLFFEHLDIPVNRSSITAAHKAFTIAGQKLDQGLTQVIYPEGTISTNGKLKPFKNGAFKLAIEKQVPIVPVANLNNWWFLQNGGFFKSNGRPGIARVVVGDPISTIGLTEKDVPELKEKVHTFIQSELNKFYGKQN
ncbi:MAG: lysophospholipid acyltransferase family protein [bacterium]|nr:lysophospholipid acyltransferase family protein [bacterium]